MKSLFGRRHPEGIGLSYQQFAIENLTRSIALVADPAGLRSIITARFREMTSCDGALFFEHPESETAYIVTAESGVVPTAGRPRIDASGSLVKWLRVNDECFVTAESGDILGYLDPSERAMVTALGVRLCVPLTGIGRLVAILFLFESKRSGAKLDRGLIGLCARQAGLALENLGLHRAEEDRLHTLRRAQQLAVAGQLAASVAHEIRNPLTAIRSSIQYVAMSEGIPPAKLDLLRDVLEEVDRIEHTLAGVLSLARPHALERLNIDLIEVVEQAAKLIQCYADSREIDLVLNLARRPLPVQGDPRELRQVFVNLLLNACQAMSAVGPIIVESDILADTRPLSDARPAAVIRVIDHGSGIPPDAIPRLFEPFFTTKKNGTGLGLAICFEVIARHGGNLRLVNGDAGGAVASVVMPLAARD